MFLTGAGQKRIHTLSDDGVDIREALTGGNGLLNNLIAYWPGNEAAGNALDLHTNGLHLTDNNTVTSNPGKVYALSRQYTRVNSEFHQRSSETLLQVGDVDFTLACWCYLDSAIADAGLIAKDGGSNAREYQLGRDVDLNRFVFSVSATGLDGSFVSVYANALGAPSLATWYLVIGWHNSVADTINIEANGIGDSAAHATGVAVKTSPLRLGIGAIAPAQGFMDGRIGPTMFWKSAGGAGGALDAVQRTALYNGGAGLPYSAFTA